MTKILVYEYAAYDLINRYSHLTGEHDIHVRHLQDHPDFARPEIFRKHGFNPDNFTNGYGSPREENADVYFLDGLKGLCFQFATELPRDKTFIYSDSGEVNQEAKRRGLNIVDLRRVEDIVREVVEKNKREK